MKLTDTILNLFFPPFCVFCQETLPYDTTDALCPVCRSRYESEKKFLCPDCGLAHRDCRCMSHTMSRYVDEAIHLAEYVKEESAVRALTLAAKDSGYEYLYRFLANELASAVKERVYYRDCLVTYVPRSRKKVAKHGIDQAKEASRRVAKSLNCEFLPLFRHTKNKEQKHLTVAEREQNAKKAYTLLAKRKDAVYKKRVILYDDVVTTGATVSACAALLKKAGAEEVICLSFAKTYPKKKKDRRATPFPKKYYKVKKTWF